MNSTDSLFFARLVLAVLCSSQPIPARDAMEVDLLICRGDESGCVAAVQSARMGVKRIAIVNDIAASLESIHEIQLRLIRGAGGPGMLIWPRHDVSPEDAIVVKLK